MLTSKPTVTVSLAQARAKFSELLDRVESGETVGMTPSLSRHFPPSRLCQVMRPRS